MADPIRELKSAAEDIQTLARRIRRDPQNSSVETWARRIVNLADDVDRIARRVER